MGVTLAIGLVVDDAIVVLENITRWIEEGTPADARRRAAAWREISFAVVAATVSSVAVFLPLAFLTRHDRPPVPRVRASRWRRRSRSRASSRSRSRRRSARWCCAPHGPSTALKAVLRARLRAARGGYDARARRRCCGARGLWVALGVAWVVLGVLLLHAHPAGADPDVGPRRRCSSSRRRPRAARSSTPTATSARPSAWCARLPEVQRVFSVVALGIGDAGPRERGRPVREPRAPRGARAQPAAGRERAARRCSRASPASPPSRPARRMISGFGASPVQFVIEGAGPRRSSRAGPTRSRTGIASMPRLRERADQPATSNKPQLEVDDRPRPRQRPRRLGARRSRATLQILLGGLDLSTFKLDGETYDVMAQLERAGARAIRATCSGSTCAATTGQLVSLALGGDGARDGRAARAAALRPRSAR